MGWDAPSKEVEREEQSVRGGKAGLAEHTQLHIRARPAERRTVGENSWDLGCFIVHRKMTLCMHI